MITTNNPNLAEKISLLRSHGGVKVGNWYEYHAAGFNYRMSDVQGAIGVAQMEKLSWIIKQKQELAHQLSHRLVDISGVRVPIEPDWGGHSFQSYVLLVDEEVDRDLLVHKMKSHEIETTLGTYALHDQPFFKQTYGYKTGQLKKSYIAYSKTITLPLYPQLKEEDLDLIAETLNTVIKS